MDSVNRNNIKEQKAKWLKRQLEPWRVCLVELFSILLWERPWCPAVLVTFTTSIFLARWYWDPSILTLIGIIGVVVTLADYFIPKISNALSPTVQWTSAKEKQYENFCTAVIDLQETVYGSKAYFKTLKESNPKLYFGILYLAFTLLAWVGYVVNNWILAYIFTLGLVLAPGIRQNKMAEKTLIAVFTSIRNRTENLSKSKQN